MPSFIRRAIGPLFFLPLILAGPCIPAQAAAEKKEIVVTVHDPAGNAPLSGVKITLRSGNSEGDGYTADDGSTHIKISTANSSYAYLNATSEGLCPVSMNWQGNTGGVSLPDHIDLVMEHAAGISGIIVDENGKSLPGASVICNVTKKYPNPLEQLVSNWRPMIADSDGKWSVTDVPETFDSVSIGAYHKDCIDGQNFINPRPFADIAGLKNGTAAYTLHRGTPVKFIIHGPEGQPVRIARLGVGSQRGSSNAYPEETADGDGIVQLGIAPGVHEIFTITAKGFAPELLKETIDKAPKTINVNLTAGNLLEGSVLDGSGDPVAEANISVQTWRGQNNLLQPRIRTDADGKFSWTDAPADDLIVSVYSELGQKSNITVRAGKENKIQLTPPATFKGTIVDAANNAPITGFKVIYGIQWGVNQPVSWQNNNQGEIDLSADSNIFTATFRQNYPSIAVRVTADGYFPCDSTSFASEGKDAEFTFKMEKGNAIKGTVVNADGKPIKGATVILALPGNNLQVQNGIIPQWQLNQAVTSETTADGTFSFPPQRGAYIVAVLADAGYSEITQADLQKNSAIQIKPWARIEGTVRRGTKPDAGMQVSGWMNVPYEPNAPKIQWGMNAVADAEGKFTIDRSSANTFSMGRQLQLGNNSTTTVNSVTFTTKSGETSKIQIGGVGRPVTGHIIVPPEITAKGFAFFQGMLQPTKMLNPQMNMFLPNPDGTFRIDDVPEGTYGLSVQLTDLSSPNQWQPGAQLGKVTASVTVPAVAGGVSNDPLDIGELHVSSVAAVSAVAPDISAKTLDGSDWKLSNQKGKVVLLYFWSATYSSNSDYLTPLKDVWNTYGQNPKFTMMGLSMSDNTGDPTKKFAAAHELQWPLAALGRDRQPLIQQYPMQSIPTFWLINDSGTIVGQNLGKDQLKTQIENTLKSSP